MSTSAERLSVTVDIFEQRSQQARPLASLTPREFVAAILTEFQPDFAQLGSDPTNYYLALVDQTTAHATELNAEKPCAEQLQNGAHLALCEKSVTPPTATTAPLQAIYLREQSQNRVFPLQWLPALIGRPNREQSDALAPAVDLSDYATGLRVSRRHAQIVEEEGRYYVESLSPTNPTLVQDTGGNRIRVTDQKQLLQDGDMIILENSEIQFQFLIRSSITGQE